MYPRELIDTTLYDKVHQGGLTLAPFGVTNIMDLYLEGARKRFTRNSILTELSDRYILKKSIDDDYLRKDEEEMSTIVEEIFDYSDEENFLESGEGTDLQIPKVKLVDDNTQTNITIATPVNTAIDNMSPIVTDSNLISTENDKPTEKKISSREIAQNLIDEKRHILREIRKTSNIIEQNELFDKVKAINDKLKDIQYQKRTRGPTARTLLKQKEKELDDIYKDFADKTQLSHEWFDYIEYGKEAEKYLLNYDIEKFVDLTGENDKSEIESYISMFYNSDKLNNEIKILKKRVNALDDIRNKRRGLK